MKPSLIHSPRWGRMLASLLLIFILGLSLPIAVWAHPLGNFTINRYSRLEVGAHQVRVRYVIDMAEIPTFQERVRMDLDHDDTISAAEQDRYLAEEVTVLQSQLQLVSNGAAIALQPQEQQLEFLPGQGGLQTLRLSLWFAAKLPQQAVWQVEYRDDNFAGRVGWQEVIVQAIVDASLLESNVPTQDLSNELRSYPQDLLQSPLAVNRATLRFVPAVAGSPGRAPTIDPVTAATTGRSIQGRNADRFTRLIAVPELSPGLIALAVLIALVWGAAHALTPGHGKTIVAAYLVGSRATVQHALFLGATTTITHTAGVFLLGLITLFDSRYIVPEQLYQWLEAVSGLLVIAVGVALLVGRLRQLSRPDRAHPYAHAVAHGHDHLHTPGSAGVLAGSTAHVADHDHDHLHKHVHDHAHPHGHDHDHDHDQGGHGHNHLPPGAEGTPVTWRSLLALGISGGLLPCPSALVVMLGAIALNRVGFGLLLIVVFSIGLAGTLTAIGVLLVRAKILLERLGAEDRLLGRIPINRQVIQALPAISALFIVLAGAGITFTALAQTEMFRW